MSVECLDLADFLLIAEQVTGIEVEALARLPRLHMAEHALSAPIIIERLDRFQLLKELLHSL
jgi:hypothetical protein